MSYRLFLLAILSHPLIAATSYANPDGTGDRRAMILCSNSGFVVGPFYNSVNGSTTEFTWFFGGTTVSSATWLKWDFLAPIVIDEATYYQQFAVSEGTWKWQGSNDNSAWTDIGSSFALGSSVPQVLTTLNGNTTAYRYYRMLGVSGSTNTGPFIQEFEFKCQDTTNARTDFTAIPAAVKQCRVTIANFNTHSGSDLISLLVGSSEKITNGSFESDTFGGAPASWTAGMGGLIVTSYAAMTVTPPTGAGLQLVRGSADGAQTSGFQLVDLSSVNLSQQIDIAAWLADTAGFQVEATSLGFSFENNSGVAIIGVVLPSFFNTGVVGETVHRTFTIPAAPALKGRSGAFGLGGGPFQ